MKFEEIYDKYLRIKQYLISKDIEGILPEHSLIQLKVDLLPMLWPNAPKHLTIPHQRLLYALAEVAIRNGPFRGHREPYFKYIKNNATTLFKVKENGSLVTLIENILYAHKIYCPDNILGINDPDTANELDLMKLKGGISISKYKFYKHREYVLSINTNIPDITSRKIGCQNIWIHLKDVLRTLEVKNTIYKNTAEKDRFLLWLSNNNKDVLISNIFKVLDGMAKNARIAGISNEYIENTICLIERLVPSISNARTKIHNALTLDLSPISIGEMLIQDKIDFSKIEMPHMDLTNF